MKQPENRYMPYSDEENLAIIEREYSDPTLAKMFKRTVAGITTQRRKLKEKGIEMPKGQKITDEDVVLMLQLRERGKSNKDIAEILELSEKGIFNKIGSDKPQKNNEPIDMASIEKKLDEMPDRLVRRISEILEFTPNMREHLLSLESIGYKSKDKKVYSKIDGNQSRQISFFNANQITYSTKDIKNDKEIERYYFNADTIEAMFDAILERGWNYFKK